MFVALLCMVTAFRPAAHPVVARIDRLGAVSTTVDGKGPYHFILDTGAGITVLTPQFARRAGLAGAGHVKATGTGGSVQVRTLTLRSVRVGGAAVHAVAAAIIPLPLDVTYQGDYGTIDGILGYSFLSHFAVTIDLRDRRLTLTSPQAYRKPPGAVSLAADLSGNTPVVRARADGIAGAFQLDTGDNGALMLTAGFVAKHHFARHYHRYVPTMFEGVGGMQHGNVVRLRAFALGGAVVRNEITTLSLATKGLMGASALAGNVGTDVLRRFVFTVDYPRRRVDFTPNAALPDYVPFTSTGEVATREADGRFRVIAVVPGSPASRAGVKPGDELVDVNGYPLARLDTAQIAEANRARSIRYTIRSPGGRERTVTFKLKDLLPRASTALGHGSTGSP